MKAQISILHVRPNQEAKDIVQRTIEKSTVPVTYENFEEDAMIDMSSEVDGKRLVIIHESNAGSSTKSIISDIINANPNSSIIRIFDKETTQDRLNGKFSKVQNLSSDDLHKLPNAMEKSFRDLTSNGENTDPVSGLFRTIVEKSSNEIFLMDPKTQKFTYANQPLLENFGYDSEEFLSRHFRDLIASDMRSFAHQMITSILNGEKDNLGFQVDCLRSDNSYFPAQLNLDKVRDRDKDYILGVCIDLSLQKRNMDLLEKEKKKTRELQLSNKYKSTFFANLSHEMRTTLNSTLLLSEILTKNRPRNLIKDQLKYISTIRHSTTSLLSLLNEVLDLSKIESGKMSMRPEYVEVVEFCKELERLFQPVASEKGIRFEFINDLDQNVPFKTDGLRLEQVLKNLISNALKFTEQGAVKLRVYRPSSDPAPVNGEGSTISFEIADTGIGIPEEHQTKIFESYIQAEGENPQNVIKGTGLGLSISKEIVELLGGKIDLTSTPGEGSTFTVELPLDSSDSILKNAQAGKIKLTTAPAKSDRIKHSDKKKPAGKIEGTVLLIDDSETHNMALSEFLSFRIKKTITAESAEKAFKVLASKKVNCIVLDMYLPDASGKEVLKKLKNDDRYSSIPVIIYSGKSISQDEEDELGTLADAIIQKNVMSYKVLLSKVTGILQKLNEPM